MGPSTIRPFILMRLLVLLLLLCSSISDASKDGSYSFPATPVVGILTQPRTSHETNETEYYVAASYLKWLEVAGARAIPIPYDASNSTVDSLFFQMNGLFFPGGGGANMPMAAKRLWQLAQDANSKQDDYFPVWGTCLGFEYLVMLASSQGETILQSGFDAENVSLPLHLTDDGNTSRLYANKRIRKIVQHENVTMNNHKMGIEPNEFRQDAGLNSMFHITSLNVDGNGRPFVSTMEPLRPNQNPYYGVQYHPEKNAFEYAIGSNGYAFEDIHHSSDAIYFSVYLAQFFGRMLRKATRHGRHIYSKPDKYPLVYSYPMKRGLGFEQYFIIPSEHQAVMESGVLPSRRDDKMSTRIRPAETTKRRLLH